MAIVDSVATKAAHPAPGDWVDLKLDMGATAAPASSLPDSGGVAASTAEHTTIDPEESFDSICNTMNNHVAQQRTDGPGARSTATYDTRESETQASSLGKALYNAKEYATQHPVKAGLHVPAGCTVLAPGLVTLPVLGLMGFGGGGIISGSMATAVHSAIGPVAARSVFATLQSAGAGGYGLPIVNGIAQGAIAAGAALKLATYKAGAPREEGEDIDMGSDEEDESEDKEVEENVEREGKRHDISRFK